MTININSWFFVYCMFALFSFCLLLLLLLATPKTEMVLQRTGTLRRWMSCPALSTHLTALCVVTQRHKLSEISCDFPNRLDESEETQESAEFLPSADGKKTTRFTDVWTHASAADGDDDERFIDQMLPLSLKEKRLSACQCSTWAMLSWAVESWDWPTPWPTLASSSSGEESSENENERIVFLVMIKVGPKYFLLDLTASAVVHRTPRLLTNGTNIYCWVEPQQTMTAVKYKWPRWHTLPEWKCEPAFMCNLGGKAVLKGRQLQMCA